VSVSGRRDTRNNSRRIVRTLLQRRQFHDPPDRAVREGAEHSLLALAQPASAALPHVLSFGLARPCSRRHRRDAERVRRADFAVSNVET
jgi:hypothetical protein